MSNISTANGRFIFDKAFVEKNGAVVSDWIENHRQSSYGFDIYGTRIDDDGGIAFTAIGRNTYRTTLKEEGIGWTTDDSEFFGESSRASLALGKALAESRSEVLVEYTDLEPDCEIYYRAKAKLRYSSATEFTVEELELDDLDLTFRVLVEAEYSEAAFDFKASDNEADVFKDFVRETYSDEVKTAGFGIEAFCTAIVGTVKEDSYRDGLLSSYEANNFDELLHIVVAEAGVIKTLEGVFNGIVLSKVSSDNDRADAKRLSMEIGNAENTYSRVLISDEALTDDGRAAVKALFNAWILVNAGLEKWEYDDRNKATYNFSVMQARRLEGINAREYPLIFQLAEQLNGLHRTLQQNLMRTLYRYFSNKGERLEAINFPMI